MRTTFPPDTRFNITVATPSFTIEHRSLTFEEAAHIVNRILDEHSEDSILQEQLKACRESFGFRGYSGGGYNITISAYRPRVILEEKSNCGSPNNDPMFFPDLPRVWEMTGDDKVCSFCGSLHPDRVIELVKEHGIGIIESITKGYKWYVTRKDVPNASFGGIKYYRWHDVDRPGFIEELKAMESNAH